MSEEEKDLRWNMLMMAMVGRLRNEEIPGAAEEYAKRNKWKLCEYDGKRMCWRKKFGGGTISVGRGEFYMIEHRFGDDSTFTGTRIKTRQKRILTESEAMAIVDAEQSAMKHRK